MYLNVPSGSDWQVAPYVSVTAVPASKVFPHPAPDALMYSPVQSSFHSQLHPPCESQFSWFEIALHVVAVPSQASHEHPN